MDQIVVPQFLDVEDKIIGPITVRQFIEMLIGGMIIFIFYKLFDFSLFAVSGLLVLGVTLIFAFLKINGQPFHYFLLNFLDTLKSPKLKVWKKDLSTEDLNKQEKKERKHTSTVSPYHHPVTSSKLSELALIVDTGGVYQGESDLPPILPKKLKTKNK